MSTKMLKTVSAAAMLFPLAVLANGAHVSNTQAQPQMQQPEMQQPAQTTETQNNTASSDDSAYSTPYLPYSSHGFKSGAYLGIQGSYVFTIDDAEFQAANPSNPSYLPEKHTNHRNSYGGSAYLGYSHIFDHGFLPYLGGELALNLRSDYNDNNSGFDDGDLYNAQINSRGGISFDILPGFFFDDLHTTLVYMRLGIEGARFQLDSDANDVDEDDVYRPLVRVGAGVEHQLIDNLYIRADYVFSAALSDIDYNPYTPQYDNKYSSQPLFNTFSIGIDYRF